MIENRIIIIDNFYDDPDYIRNFALQQSFIQRSNGVWNIPGSRTEHLGKLNSSVFEIFKSKLYNNLFHPFTLKHNVSINEFTHTAFHIHSAADGDGWVHVDPENDINAVGLIYLTPNPPPNSGTIFYKLNEKFVEEFKQYKNFYELNRKDDPVSYEKFFEIQQVVENKYNRAVIFSNKTHHKSDFYFGDTIENCRLTQPFFLNIRDFSLQELN